MSLKIVISSIEYWLFLTNINILIKIPSNDNINVGRSHHDIGEYNNVKNNTYCWIYIPSIYWAPKLLRFNKYDNINDVYILCQYFLNWCQVVPLNLSRFLLWSYLIYTEHISDKSLYCQK